MAGTPVAVEYGAARIDQLQTGDVVLGLDLRAGAVCAQKVTTVIQADGTQILELDFGDEVVACTPAHRFYTGRWVAAGDLASGDRVLRSDGGWQELQDARPSARRQPVFNLEVEDLHNFLVGQSGLLVHNVKDENGAGNDGPPVVKAPRRRSQQAYTPRRGRRQGA